MSIFRGMWFKFQNLARHIEAQADNDVTMYAMNGNLYFKVGRGQPRLVAGQTIINNYVQSGGTDAGANIRSGKILYESSGSHQIIFTEPLGTTGTDYNLVFDVRDADGAIPSFSIPSGDMTKYGFRVVTYDDNITFGWTAILNTQ